MSAEEGHFYTGSIYCNNLVDVSNDYVLGSNHTTGLVDKIAAFDGSVDKFLNANKQFVTISGSNVPDPVGAYNVVNVNSAGDTYVLSKIVDSNIDSAANISLTKLASMGNSHVLLSNSSGNINTTSDAIAQLAVDNLSSTNLKIQLGKNAWRETKEQTIATSSSNVSLWSIVMPNNSDASGSITLVLKDNSNTTSTPMKTITINWACFKKATDPASLVILNRTLSASDIPAFSYTFSVVSNTTPTLAVSNSSGSVTIIASIVCEWKLTA